MMRRAVDTVIGLLAAAALVLACMSVFLRYVAPSLAVDWSDEIVVMLLIWAMFLTGYRVTLDRAHVSVDLLTHGRSGALKRRLDRAAQLALGTYALAMATSGVLVLCDAWRLGERTESTARVPTVLYYAALPAGMFLIALAVGMLLAGHCTPPADDQPEDAL
jgi:TRAP-type C4-dicarboxylate transport system permease small subunit